MKLEPDIRTIRRLENKTQVWLGEKLGVKPTTVYAQEQDEGNATSFGRVKEILNILGYELYAEKRKED